MTLRGRLTAAFLAVVLGPVLLGAFLVGSAVVAVDRSRSAERLAVAAAAVRTSVDALCQQLRAAADAVALTAETARPGAADQVVSRGLAAAVQVTDATGRVTYTTPGAPTTPWWDCTAAPTGGGPVRALSARVDLRDPAGVALGTVAAAWQVDAALVARLAAVTGAAVDLLDDPAGPADATAVTDRPRPATAPDRVTEVDGRYLRRVGPAPGQPLPLLLSVPSDRPTGLY
ncbi:diguanylate cyclase, partial [Micromonospora fluostatini]